MFHRCIHMYVHNVGGTLCSTTLQVYTCIHVYTYIHEYLTCRSTCICALHVHPCTFNSLCTQCTFTIKQCPCIAHAREPHLDSLPPPPSLLPHTLPLSLLTQCIPLHLLAMFLLSCLGLHLLYFNGVRLSAAHVQLVIAHTQGKDTLVDAEPRCIEHKVLKGKHTIVNFFGGSFICLPLQVWPPTHICLSRYNERKCTYMYIIWEQY